MNNRAASSGDLPRTDDLLHAANDSARLFRRAYVSFVLVSLYLLTIALSADDELLFRDGELTTFRFFEVGLGVKASQYFVAAPWILVLLHLSFLILGTFLTQKIGEYLNALPAERSLQYNEMLRLLLPVPLAQLASGGSPGLAAWLLRLSGFTTMVFLPLVILGALQAQFLDFQSTRITWMHSGLILVDCALVWYLWPKVRRLYAKGIDQAPLLQQASTIVLFLFFLVIGPLVPDDAVMPVTAATPSAGGDGRRENNANRSGYIREWLRSLHTLDVRNRRLYMNAASASPTEACQDRTLAFNGAGRSYRGARLSEAVLCHAVLVGARLEGAEMSFARLHGADLSGAALDGAILSQTGLQDAVLVRARLRQADLGGAQLQLADLRGASLQGANFALAELQRARLDGAGMQGADLGSAGLQGASLVWARLQGADLRGALLRGADLSNAQLQTAILARADLVGAKLIDARLWMADVSNADLQGATLINARLQGADLQGAQLQGVVSLPTNASRLPDLIRRFKESIQRRIEEETELATVVFDGGIIQEDLDLVIQEMAGYTVDEYFRIQVGPDGSEVAEVVEDAVPRFIEEVRAHVGTSATLGTPTLASDRGATIGRYTASDTERWIARHAEDVCVTERFDPEYFDRGFLRRWAEASPCSEEDVRISIEDLRIEGIEVR